MGDLIEPEQPVRLRFVLGRQNNVIKRKNHRSDKRLTSHDVESAKNPWEVTNCVGSYTAIIIRNYNGMNGQRSIVKCVMHPHTCLV